MSSSPRSSTEGPSGRPGTPQDGVLPPLPASPTAPPPVVKTATWVPMSADLLADQPSMVEWQRDLFDRMLHPWKYPDKVRWPTFVPLPRLQSLVGGLRARRRRLRDARLVLRGHAVIRDDDWDDE